MSQIEVLKHEVKKLSSKELAAFRSWFTELDNAQWDRQIEMDSTNGKLDKPAQIAIVEGK